MHVSFCKVADARRFLERSVLGRLWDDVFCGESMPDFGVQMEIKIGDGFCAGAMSDFGVQMDGDEAVCGVCL